MTRFRPHHPVAAVALALAVGACSVQLVSPYNAQLADGLTKLNEDVIRLAADVDRTASNPATRSKARYEEYGKTYDDLHARVETMRIISEIGNPGVVDCPKLTQGLQSSVRAMVAETAGGTVAGPSEATEAAPNVDCQTFLFIRLQRRIDAVERLHKAACAPTNPNLEECRGVFGRAPRAFRFGENSTALAIQPTLTTIRALMWVQETKKPKAN
jgi:hypothetical protein